MNWKLFGKEAVVAYFKLLSLNSAGVTEKNHKKLYKDSRSLGHIPNETCVCNVTYIDTIRINEYHLTA
jgi:hypothetical protein